MTKAKYEEILSNIDKDFEGVPTNEIYKFLTEKMGDEMNELMKEYDNERSRMTKEEIDAAHKLFKRMGIIQKIIIERD